MCYRTVHEHVPVVTAVQRVELLCCRVRTEVGDEALSGLVRRSVRRDGSLLPGTSIHIYILYTSSVNVVQTDAPREKFCTAAATEGWALETWPHTAKYQRPKRARRATYTAGSR